MPGNCFVIMGFGEKTDYRTQRKLDLDKTYRIISKAVKAADLECIRADEIIHAGIIDKPMYEQLLLADFVIADLSTSNENAIYELGVRHALRPNTTIVIAESQFKFPFDLNSLIIRTYQHLGSGIDFEEADSLAENITTALKTLKAKNQVDSPVYTMLPGLRAPTLKEQDEDTLARKNSETTTDNDATSRFFDLLERYQNARATDDFAEGKVYLKLLLESQPDDPYLNQQLALTTYKSKSPDTVTALESARAVLLDKLAPHETNDPETLGLWGAIHKRLWEELQQDSDLDEAIIAYGRGFFLRRDYYTGINYAFMLNVRAPRQASKIDTIADCVLATRMRHQLLKIIDKALQQIPKQSKNTLPEGSHEVYWLEASRLEALLGLARTDQLASEKERVYPQAPEPWMQATTEEQLDKLQALIDQVQPVLDMRYTEFVAAVRESETMSSFAIPG